MIVAVMRHSEMDRTLAKVMRKSMAVKVSEGSFVQYGRLTKRSWRPEDTFATYDISAS